MAAWLAATSPAPSRMLPESTTTRVPKRSESAPQKNDPTPMQRKFSIAASEMPLRDHPIASDMGWRNTPSESIEPSPIHVITMPVATMTQP